jgi:hypothetical protein
MHYSRSVDVKYAATLLLSKSPVFNHFPESERAYFFQPVDCERFLNSPEVIHIAVFWDKRTCSLVGGSRVSEEHISSVLRVE